MRCPNCGGVIFINDVCKNCGAGFRVKPRFKPLGGVDIFRLAEGLAKKKEWETLPQWVKENKVGLCLKCNKQSLIYNKFASKYECLNLDCKQIYTRKEFEMGDKGQ